MNRAGRRVAVVTGANRGLGNGIARRLADQGLHVVITARDIHAAQAAAGELAGEDRSLSACQLDVTDPASVARAIADTAFTYGRLDVLVNNAAIAIDRNSTAAAADMERVIATLDANVVGAWRCCTAAVPEMLKNGYGRIVNITTHTGTFAEMDQRQPGLPRVQGRSQRPHPRPGRRATRHQHTGQCRLTREGQHPTCLRHHRAFPGRRHRHHRLASPKLLVI